MTKLDTASLQPKGCFACGPENPHGLHAVLTRTEGGASGVFVPNEHHEGWPGVVHGGVIASLLDEAMAYALWFQGLRGVTARMETRFRRTVSAGDKLVLIGHVLQVRHGLVDAKATLTLEETLVAEGHGRFMVWNFPE